MLYMQCAVRLRCVPRLPAPLLVTATCRLQRAYSVPVPL